MRAASGPAAGRPRHAVKVALLISAILHSLLLVGSLLRGTAAGVETPVIDSRVSPSEGTLLLSLEDFQPGHGRSESESFTVKVAQSLPEPAAEGAGPHVDLGSLEDSRPARGGGQIGTGGGRGASLFGTPIKGKSVVYVIDRSLSMGGPFGGLIVARAELLASLEALPAATRFQVVFYNSAAQPLRVRDTEGLLPADPETLREAAALVRATCAEGNTDHVQALRCGLGLRPDVLFFVTDADDLSPEQVRTVTAFNRGQTMIHTVCVARRPQATTALEQLARANGGVCLHPSTSQPHP